MKPNLKVVLGQLSPVVGDFEGNGQKIQRAFESAALSGAQLFVTPEMALCGYPPLDLLEHPDWWTRSQQALVRLQKVSQDPKFSHCALLVGTVHTTEGDQRPESPRPRRPLFNEAVALLNGKTVFRQAKTLLPVYDVFDESRYFEPASTQQLWHYRDWKIGVGICEDFWKTDETLQFLYDRDPVLFWREQKADLLISLSASPYAFAKKERRLAVHAQVAKNVQAPLLYVNSVGATDELLFDGRSFVMDANGQLQGLLPAFQAQAGELQLTVAAPTSAPATVGCGAGWTIQPEDPMQVLAEGLVLGIRDYFDRTGFQKTILGLSGGIDSAVVAVLAVRALGAQNVLGIAMPGPYSSTHSYEDAKELASNLKILLQNRPIKFTFTQHLRELSEGRGELTSIAQENLQSRLRGLTLSTLANHENALILNTGNKSELAMGYATQYGDLIGALGPLGDLYKTEVYALAKWINQHWKQPIPMRSIDKAPSAELRPNQTDQDTLPPYAELDLVLKLWLEERLGLDAICKRTGKKIAEIAPILQRMELNEYKRRQAPPVLRVSEKAFGLGRRVPLAKPANWFLPKSEPRVR